jgi:hypothetical protein
VPRGEVRWRNLLAYDSVPAPPDGYTVMTFRTSFANRPDAVQTVSLMREGDG